VDAKKSAAIRKRTLPGAKKNLYEKENPREEKEWEQTLSIRLGREAGKGGYTYAPVQERMLERHKGARKEKHDVIRQG